MDPDRMIQMKTKLRRMLLNIICTLSMDEITAVNADELRKEQIFTEIIRVVHEQFMDGDPQKMRSFINSVVGNATILGDNLEKFAPEEIPESYDKAKCEHWTNRWRAEREKQKRARNIDTQEIFSKKMRKELAGPADAPSDHLEKTRFNSSCSITITIPYEAIHLLKKLGSGSYGVAHQCTIKGISWLPEDVFYCCKEFKGSATSRLQSFSQEASLPLSHQGIVRAVAQTKREPWALVFPYFNGHSLGDLMECVPPPKGSLSNVLIRQGESVNKTPNPEEFRMCQILITHGPSVIHAMIQALLHAHNEGILHCDLHPWNIMTDFTKDGKVRVGIIDWGLALRDGLERRKTNITNKKEHKIRPWRADELLNYESPCPYSKSTDLYAICWCIDYLCLFCKEFSQQYNVELSSLVASKITCIRTILAQGYLKKVPEQRRSIEELDLELSGLELHPEESLRPMLEMMPRFY